ncbi:RedY protein [Streptomyces sp. NBC_00878]|uniref:RedY protein n=1 Tax=Streptomyces sp. NBC_00878 TaxID=2975854 RepID=UPI002258D876|nr:RedY protein [Streptomyces sp. NBC_00878]MCX4911597.1 RedY protein [Streptomyces sp. NBC_00878]
MAIIVHRIRLHDGVEPARFETWVRDVDYATCPELPSVVSFSVQRVVEESRGDAGPTVGGESCHFFEIIEVTSREAFEQDMRTVQFQGLVTEFDKMAKVVDETVGERVGTGYTA